jgi:hypothetical protein
MSKRYSGKSFKDSSVKKQPKLNLKEKKKNQKRKAKKIKLVKNLLLNSLVFWFFLSFQSLLLLYNGDNL